MGTRARGRFIRHTTVVTVVALMATAAMSAVIRPPTAHADDDDTSTHEIVQGVDGTLAYETSELVVSNGGQIITMPPGDRLDPGCIVTAANQVCFGQTSVGTDPVDISSGPVLEGERLAALGWIVDEARVSAAGMYDVADDERVAAYARGDLRAYVVRRIVDILDKSAFNVPLTDNEARTLAFVEEHLLTENRALTGYALEEYNRWKALDCSYVPPAAPSYVTSPVAMPGEVVQWCNRAKSGFEVLFTFAPPMPSVAHFQTWGLYRQAAEFGLDVIEHPAFQKNLTSTALGITTLAAAPGLLGAAMYGAVAGKASVIIAGLVSSATGSGLGFTGATAGASVSSGLAAGTAAMAAGVIAIVVIFLIILIVASIQLGQNISVGNTLVTSHNNAMADTDPLQLAPLRVANVGTTLAQGRANYEANPFSLPPYRRVESVDKLQELVTRWMTIDSHGGVVADPVGVWPDNETTDDDYRFRVSGVAEPFVTDEITVPTADGNTAKVRFNRGWMIVTPIVDGVEGAPYATPKLHYLDSSGRPSMASRTATGDWLVSFDQDEFTTDTITHPAIFVVEPGGGARSVTIEEPTQSLRPRELVPSVAGPLQPDRIHNLRPNPVDPDGAFNLATFTEDYAYDWHVRRFDPDAGQWVTVEGLEGVAVGDNPSYGARFTPPTTGEYQATVTMTNTTDDTAPVVTGRVAFVVGAPDIDVTSMTLVDDPETDTLRVDLQLAEQVPTDDITVDVTWPGQIDTDDPGPTAQVVLPCHTTDVIICSTVDTALFPEFGAELTHVLGTRSDLREPVVVTATNSHGASITRELDIDAATRPRLVEPPAGSGAGQPGIVTFDSFRTHVELPVSAPDADPNYTIAGIEPGSSSDGSSPFFLVDPATGNRVNQFQTADGVTVGVRNLAGPGSDPEWVVEMRAVPNLRQLGVYEIPVMVEQWEQEPLFRKVAGTTTVLTLEVVAATEDRYRGGLITDVDPSDFFVEAVPDLVPIAFGGQPEWGSYDGDLCVELVSGAFNPPPICDHISAFYDGDVPLAFPYQRFRPHGLEPGIYRARAWVPGSEQNYDAPVEVTFGLPTGAPTIHGLAWNNDAGHLELDLESWSSGVDPLGIFAVSDPLEITSIVCTLDDGPPVDDCFGLADGVWSSTWNPGALALGAHRLAIVVTDETRNYTTGEFDFTVEEQGVDPDPDPDPTPTPTPTPNPNPNPNPNPTPNPDPGPGGGTDPGADAGVGPGSDTAPATVRPASLAFTGVSLAMLLQVAILLLCAAGALLLATRRHRTRVVDSRRAP